MSQRETRDFMSVDAFSQLPFIRPAPPRDKTGATTPNNNSSNAIRLFGIEFTHDDVAHREEEESSSSSKENNVDKPSNAADTNNASGGGGVGGGESNRRFECHYCCRNFPTSQALGGHQNAHKRERQHAKRAHLQSAMAAAHHHGVGGIAGAVNGHVYGALVNYHRLGSIVPSSARFGIGGSHALDYPSWNATATSSNHFPATPRIYGEPGSVTQPINGSPLPGLWRIPSASTSPSGGLTPLQRDVRSSASAPLPLFSVVDDSRTIMGGGRASFTSSSQNRSVFEATTRGGGGGGENKDHLSLDLHL